MPRAPLDPTARVRILDAADRLFARHGFRRMTVEAIATEAEIGKGSVYLHFASKDEVALSCIDRMVEQLIERLRALAARRGSALERLRAMLRLRVLHRFDYARTHSGSIDDLLAAIRPALLARRAGYFRREAEALEGVLAEGHRRGEVREHGRETARALVTATNSMLPYSLSVHELGRRAAIARRAGAVADLLVAGLAAPSRLSPTTPRARVRARASVQDPRRIA